MVILANLIFNYILFQKISWQIFFSISVSSLIIMKLFNINFTDELKTFRSLIGTLRYLIWLLKEIIISSLLVAYKILRYKTLANRIISLRNIDLNIEKKALFANSITLTPGTFVVNFGKTITVHCIDKNFAEATEENLMYKKIKNL